MHVLPTGAPILLLQWVNHSDPKLTEAALSAFEREAKIMHVDVGTKAEAVAAIERWLDRNPNAQFLFIGTHGDKDGIGLDQQNGLYWSELWLALKKAVRPVALWLGACESAHVARAWSPVQGEAPVDYIVGFTRKIYSDEIEGVLHKLLEMTRIDPVTFIDQEIPTLHQAISNSSVQLHYKAPTKNGRVEYVDFNDFPTVVGMTLKEYLER